MFIEGDLEQSYCCQQEACLTWDCGCLLFPYSNASGLSGRVYETLGWGNPELTERILSWQSLCRVNRIQLQLTKIKPPPPDRVEAWILSGCSYKDVDLSWVLKDGQDLGSHMEGRRYAGWATTEQCSDGLRVHHGHAIPPLLSFTFAPFCTSPGHQQYPISLCKSPRADRSI